MANLIRHAAASAAATAILAGSAMLGLTGSAAASPATGTTAVGGSSAVVSASFAPDRRRCEMKWHRAYPVWLRQGTWLRSRHWYLRHGWRYGWTDWRHHRVLVWHPAWRAFDCHR